MDMHKIKTAVFDIEQAITFAREAIEEGDGAAITTALRTAQKELEHVLAEIDHGQPGEH